MGRPPRAGVQSTRYDESIIPMPHQQPEATEEQALYAPRGAQEIFWGLGGIAFVAMILSIVNLSGTTSE